MFRKTQDVPPIAEDAIAIGAKVLWQQLGVENEAAAAKARAAGLETVMDRCVKIEHGRLFGGLNWVGVNTQGDLGKTPPLARVLRPMEVFFPSMGRIVRLFEGRFGRLVLTISRPQERDRRRRRTRHRAAAGATTTSCSSIPANRTSALGATRALVVHAAGEWLRSSFPPCSTPTRRSRSRGRRSRSRRASASSPTRWRSRC